MCSAVVQLDLWLHGACQYKGTTRTLMLLARFLQKARCSSWERGAAHLVELLLTNRTRLLHARLASKHALAGLLLLLLMLRCGAILPSKRVGG